MSIPSFRPVPPSSNRAVSAGALQDRWYPRRLFNHTAPPQDQVANPLKFAVLVGLAAFLFRWVASIPVAVAAYIWQMQRNRDAGSEVTR